MRSPWTAAPSITRRHPLVQLHQEQRRTPIAFNKGEARTIARTKEQLNELTNLCVHTGGEGCSSERSEERRACGGARRLGPWTAAPPAAAPAAPAAVGEVRTPPSRCGQSRWVAAAVAGGRGEGLRDGETESFSLSSVAAGGWWPIVSKLQPMVTNRYKLLWAWKPNQTNPFAVSAY